MSIRDQFRPCSRDSSAEEQPENQIKQCSDGEPNLQTDIMHRHHAQASVLCQKNKAIGTPSRLRLSKTTKTTKGTTRVPEILHFRAGNRSKSNEEGGKQHCFFWYPCGSFSSFCFMNQNSLLEVQRTSVFVYPKINYSFNS